MTKQRSNHGGNQPNNPSVITQHSTVIWWHPSFRHQELIIPNPKPQPPLFTVRIYYLTGTLSLTNCCYRSPSMLIGGDSASSQHLKSYQDEAPTFDSMHSWWIYSAAPLENQDTSTIMEYTAQCILSWHLANQYLTCPINTGIHARKRQVSIQSITLFYFNSPQGRFYNKLRWCNKCIAISYRQKGSQNSNAYQCCKSLVWLYLELNYQCSMP